MTVPGPTGSVGETASVVGGYRSEAAIRRGTLSLLFDRSFGPWFWSNLVSNSGDWLFNLTAAVVVYNLTGSALLVGLVSAAQFSAIVVLSPWAGGLSDRRDRRKVLLTGQTIAAVCAAALAVPVVLMRVEGLPGAWPILVAALGIGVGKAIAQPSIQSLVPLLVDDVDLESAVALTGLTFNVGRALGPAGAGVLLATLGPESAIAINAVTFVVLIVTVAFLRLRRPIERATTDGSVLAAFRYVRSHRPVFLLLAAVATTGFAADPVLTVAPALSALLGGGEVLVAAMVSVFGIVAAPAALASGRLQRRFGSVNVARSGMGIMACGLALSAMAPFAEVALAGFAIGGAGFMLAVTSIGSVLHRQVPDVLRGRVMALWGVAFLGTRPVAAIVDGTIADLAGARAGTGVGVVVAVLGVVLLSRVLADQGHVEGDRFDRAP